MATQKKRTSPKSKSKSKTKATAGRDMLRLQIVFAGVVLTILAAVALYLTRGPQPDRATEVVASQVVDELSVELDSLLLRNGLSLNQIDRIREPELLRYEVRGPVLSAPELDRLLVRLRLKFEAFSDQRQLPSGEIAYYWRGALVGVLRFEPGEIPPVFPPPVKRPQLAIIMDDLGRSLTTARELIGLDLHVTLSILPHEPLATEVAALAQRKAQESMLHVPMEPHDYPQTNPGNDALLLGQPPEEIQRRLASMFAEVPTVVGANNHMGSRFSEYADGMDVVLQTMRERGLFFIDSRTSSRSVIVREAEKAGVPVAMRDVFLDNVAEVEAIREQIRKLVRLAKHQGMAIGICHPYSQTLAALKAEQALLKNGEVEMVFVSQLVR